MRTLKEDIKKPIKIGILGGTFDPIHYGHLVSAQWSMEKFQLDKVIFIPAGSPPHKLHKNVLDAHYRYFMTLLATVDYPYLEVSNIEIGKEGPSYTIDTINQLKDLYSKDSQLFFITGADSILDFYTWKRYEELIHTCEIIATSREGYDNNKFKERIDEIYNNYGKKILEIELPSIGISSTQLRNRIKLGKSVKFLLPPLVEKYIEKNKLYLS